MKYNYCPVCGDELPPHHLGKLCGKCARKEFVKSAVKTVVIAGVAVAVGAGAYYYVTTHKKETARAAEQLASSLVTLQMKKLQAEQKLLKEASKTAQKLLERSDA